MNQLAWKLLGAVAALALLLGLYEMTPVIGPRARVERVAEDRDAWRRATEAWTRNAGAWQASFRASEKLRDDEGQAALTATNAQQSSCDARVAEARRSSKAIERLLSHEPPKPDARGCPGRALLDPGELRDALAPAAR